MHVHVCLHHDLLLFVSCGVVVLLFPFLNLSSDHEERDTCKGTQGGVSARAPDHTQTQASPQRRGTLTAE